MAAGVPRDAVVAVASRLPAGTSGIAQVLVADGLLDEGPWWRHLARRLGLAHLERLPAAPSDEPPPPPEVMVRARQAWLPAEPRPALVVAPQGEEIDRTAAILRADPSSAMRLAIAAPAVIREGLVERHGAALTARARGDPAPGEPAGSRRPSARHLRPIPGWTLVVAGLAAAALAALDSGLVLVVAAGLQLVFAVLGLLRLLAALEPRPSPAAQALADAALPRYAVLVPLHREAEVVSALVDALKALDYPADRLVLRLVVEADDTATLAASRAATRGSAIELIVVPPSEPRTKPKALNFALACVDADLVTVYDAEDRPEPGQLRRAAAAFAAGPPDLVCLQAALEIDHAPSSRPWLVRQFALEYAMLFRGLLPWLGGRGLWFPLGGTSNHFRLPALRAVGGWDAWNVTEDADVAVRLARAGGRLATFASHTGEEAPLGYSAWRGQRRRWMKGWLQTWAVHTASPTRLYRDLGPAGFALVQLMVAGHVLSALVYPFGVAVLLLRLVFAVDLFADRSFAADLALALALVGFGLALLGTVLLARRVRRSGDPWFPIADLLTMPAYWLLLSVAVVDAVRDLSRDPHGWRKTRHGLAARASTLDGGASAGGEAADPLAEPAPPGLSIGRTRV